jgi:hypothetical protein
VLWVSDNFPIPLDGRDNAVPDFSGQVTKITLGTGPTLTGTAQTYITGLPRSNGDHVTNSLEFRVNPDAGQPGEPSHLLYLVQGSNSAMGQADSAWGFRPERLLNAAVLEIDPTRTPPAGGFNVATEPLPTDGQNRRFTDNDNNLKDDGIPMGNGNLLFFDANGVAEVRNSAGQVIQEFYDPFAPNAVLKIFATGQRNAYDLVWHSNGYLYVPTNGSAAGGNVPDNPNTAYNEGRTNVGLQNDYLFKVVEGGYYGHPNPLRDEFVMNNGSVQGTAPDSNYRADGVYSLGTNRSPNGAIEYTSNVFGASLKNALLFTEYSGGNDIRAILLDANGNPIPGKDFVLRNPQGVKIEYVDPLDIIQGNDGTLYLLTLNRSNGQSQIVRLDPAPGGATGDVTADQGGDLTLTAENLSNLQSAVFRIAGLDADITSVTVSFANGALVRTVTPVNGTFTVDLSSLQPGPVTATLVARDAANNTATKATTFTVAGGNAEYVSLGVIQAEDNTPNDGTSVSIATGTGAQIQIRTAANLETGTTGLVNGLRPGAYGLDGNTNNLDGTPGGYADFGSSNADFLTFTMTVAADRAGPALLAFRYANGDSPTEPDGGARPLDLYVNGVLIGRLPFLRAPARRSTHASPTGRWSRSRRTSSPG